jgi:protein-L-isoaspartate O-methyltransferase
MVEQSAIDWIKESQGFDTIVSLYDQYRPGYPQELVGDLVSLISLLKGGKILEIGSGTGKATILVARLGYAIHCIEPDTHLIKLAADNLQGYPAITFEIARFEESVEFIAQKLS